MLKIYLSHPIRGLERDVSRDEELRIMAQNNQKAMMAAEMIRAAYSDVQVYCPAEHEDFVAYAYFNHYLTEDSILDIDCGIIDNCDAILFFNHQGTFSNGMNREYGHAMTTSKPIVITNSFEELANLIVTGGIDKLTEQIKEVNND